VLVSCNHGLTTVILSPLRTHSRLQNAPKYSANYTTTGSNRTENSICVCRSTVGWSRTHADRVRIGDSGHSATFMSQPLVLLRLTTWPPPAPRHRTLSSLRTAAAVCYHGDRYLKTSLHLRDVNTSVLSTFRNDFTVSVAAAFLCYRFSCSLFLSLFLFVVPWGILVIKLAIRLVFSARIYFFSYHILAAAKCAALFNTKIDNDVVSSFYLCQLFWPPWYRARKCKHFAARTMRSPRWR